MPSAQTCSECGQPLPGGDSEALCPVCALRSVADDPFVLEHLAGEVPQSAREREPASSTRSGAPLPCSLGDYELLEEIARGGMGVVFRARQKSLNRTVALKLVIGGPVASAAALQRFQAEAQTAAGLQHPNIVAVHEVGEHAGQAYFSMDYVEGRDLAQVLLHGPLPPRQAAGYVKVIAEAIQYAHQRGILHRDLKPSNVLIDQFDQPRITDFGLAKRLSDPQLSTLSNQLTLTGQVLGSPNFMAPEQAQGTHARSGPWSDVYSIGALLYHLITGRPPFQAATLTEVLRQVVANAPAAPRLLNASLPVDLETICLKCLEKEPGRRYPTAQALADDLGRFLGRQPILARPIGPLGKTWRWCRRKPQVAGLAAVAILTFILGFAGVVWQWRQSEGHRRRAESQTYISDINAAQAALKDDNPARVLEILNRHRPPASSRAADLRGFEWRYLWQQCQTEAEWVGRMPSRIRSLEISPDGRWLVAGSELGGISLWDRQTGEEIILAPEAGTNGGIKGFANFSPDSALVAYTDQTAASPGGRISFFETRTRKPQPPITDSWWTGGVPAFSSDGRVFAYGIASPRFERGVVVMDFATRKQTVRAMARTGINRASSIHGMDFVMTADGSSIICSENDPDRRLVHWTLSGEGGTNYFPAHGEAITALAISPDGKTLATAAGWTEKVIKLWEIPSFRPLGELPGHKAWVAGLKFSPDSQTLASAGTDKTIRLWDVPTRTLQRSFGPLPQAVYRVCFTPDGKQVFGGLGDGLICSCRVDAPPLRLSWREPAKLNRFTASSDGGNLAAIRQGVVLLSESEACVPMMPLPELGTNNVSLLFSPNGNILFAGSQNGEVTIFPLNPHQPPRRLQLPPDPVVALGQDAAGQILIVAQVEREARSGRPCRVSLWRTRDWHEQRAWAFTAAAPCIAVSPDGRWLATGHVVGPVQVWDLAHFSGNRTFSFSGRISGVAFSPDGRFLAAASREGMVQVWDVRGFREHDAFRAHSSDLSTLVFSPDGRRLLTGGDNQEAIKFWDVNTWQQLIALERPGESFSQIALNAHGTRIVAKNSAGDLLFWQAPSFAEIEAREGQNRWR